MEPSDPHKSRPCCCDHGVSVGHFTVGSWGGCILEIPAHVVDISVLGTPLPPSWKSQGSRRAAAEGVQMGAPRWHGRDVSELEGGSALTDGEGPRSGAELGLPGRSGQRPSGTPVYATSVCSTFHLGFRLPRVASGPCEVRGAQATFYRWGMNDMVKVMWQESGSIPTP